MVDQDSKPQQQIGDYQRLVEAGADITGGLAGAVTGSFVAGPPGAIVGALLSPAVRLLIGLASDVIQRRISARETKRIGATLTFATARIRERLDAGEQIRSDGFFDDAPGDQSTASEIAEGVVLAAQREHEERKLKCYGTLLANLAFTPGVDRAYSNFLIRTAEALTYRQLCLLILFAAEHPITAGGLRQNNYRGIKPSTSSVVSHDTLPVLYEIFDLCSRQLLACGGSALLGLTDINPSRMQVQGAGAELLSLMELHTLPMDDVIALIPLLQ